MEKLIIKEKGNEQEKGLENFGKTRRKTEINATECCMEDKKNYENLKIS